MFTIVYISHPEVVIDPAVPVANWGLNEVGRARVARLLRAAWLAPVTRVISSAEVKAMETARPLAEALGVPLEIREAMGENDRTATGYLPKEEFEATADAFFARPEESIRGWERATDAQARIVREIDGVLARADGPVACIGHGAVGTLAWCHYAGVAIDRRHDQVGGGGGCYWQGAPRPEAPWQRWEDHPG